MDTPPRTPMRKVVASSLIGTSLEWYDFFLYGSAAALVFDKLFFPNYDPVVGTILAFATFAIGFVSRPLGGVVFGHFGDKIGRKNILVITLILMGSATMAIGVLPVYSSIGVAAPLLLILMRFLQGLGLGGEWGGAVLMPFEHAGARWRGFASSWPQSGGPLGMLLATGVLALTGGLLTEQQFLNWGWRLPFLFSGVVVLVGLWIRFSITESPEFEKAKSAGELPSNPVLEVLRDHRSSFFRAMGARVGVDILYYTLALLVLTYVTKSLGLPRDVALFAVIVGSVVQAALIPAFGALSDRIGRRPIMIGGAVAGALWAFAFFPLLDTRSPVLITVAVTVGLAMHAALYGAQAAFISELFPPRVRYTGASMGYQFAGILGGALAPIVALALLEQFGTTLSVSIYVLVGLSLVVLAVLFSKETAFGDAAAQTLPDREMHATTSPHQSGDFPL